MDILLNVAIHGPDYCSSVKPSLLHKITVSSFHVHYTTSHYFKYCSVFREPWVLERCHAPISSALYEHPGSWASPRFNRGIFHALCLPIGYRVPGTQS